MAGYEDVNDAERLSQDPTFRLISSDRICDARRFYLTIAVDRDGATDSSEKSCWSGGDQSRVYREVGNYRLSAAGSAGYGQH
jgi:hypothetical protein